MISELRHGICSRYSGVFFGITKRAVINLGAGDYVSTYNDSWWIKDTHLMSPPKLWHTRFKIIRKVGGFKALDKEVERLIKLEERSDIPPKLISTEQLWKLFPYPKTLGQILHEVGCPGVDPSQDSWARKEIIAFIYRRWDYLRIILIDKKDEIIQNQTTPLGSYCK